MIKVQLYKRISVRLHGRDFHPTHEYIELSTEGYEKLKHRGWVRIQPKVPAPDFVEPISDVDTVDVLPVKEYTAYYEFGKFAGVVELDTSKKPWEAK